MTSFLQILYAYLTITQDKVQPFHQKDLVNQSDRSKGLTQGTGRFHAGRQSLRVITRESVLTHLPIVHLPDRRRFPSA